MRLGCDYVTGPTVQQLHKVGITFVGRYLSTPGNPKNLTVQEARRLHAAGLDIVLVFENDADDALHDHPRGVTDARLAHAAARALGAPARQPIYFTVDVDAKDYAPQLPDTKANAHAKLGPIAGYFEGVAANLGPARVGGYGDYYVIRRLLNAGLIQYAWETYAWSGTPTRWDPRTHIRQVKNGQRIGSAIVDLDHAMRPEFGQWRAKPQPPVTITGPKGGLIGHRTVNQARRLLPGLLARFRKVTLRKR